MNLNWLKIKELVTFYSGWHSNWVTIATKYVPYAHHSKEHPYQTCTKIDLKQISYWHFTMVAMVTEQQGMWMMLITWRNLHAKHELKLTENKGVSDILVWLPWYLTYHSDKVSAWCLLLQGTSMPNMNSNWFKRKELLRFHSGCDGNWITLATRCLADAYHSKEPPYQTWAQIDLKQRSYSHFTLVAMVTGLP